MNSYLCKNNDTDYQKEPWFISGLNEFKSSNWNMEIDRFHLNDDSLKTKLMNFAEKV